MAKMKVGEVPNKEKLWGDLRELLELVYGFAESSPKDAVLDDENAASYLSKFQKLAKTYQKRNEQIHKKWNFAAMVENVAGIYMQLYPKKGEGISVEIARVHLKRYLILNDAEPDVPTKKEIADFGGPVEAAKNAVADWHPASVSSLRNLRGKASLYPHRHTHLLSAGAFSGELFYAMVLEKILDCRPRFASKVGKIINDHRPRTPHQKRIKERYGMVRLSYEHTDGS